MCLTLQAIFSWYIRQTRHVDRVRGGGRAGLAVNGDVKSIEGVQGGSLGIFTGRYPKHRILDDPQILCADRKLTGCFWFKLESRYTILPGDGFDELRAIKGTAIAYCSDKTCHLQRGDQDFTLPNSDIGRVSTAPGLGMLPASSATPSMPVFAQSQATRQVGNAVTLPVINRSRPIL